MGMKRERAPRGLFFEDELVFLSSVWIAVLRREQWFLNGKSAMDYPHTHSSHIAYINTY